QDPVFQRRPCRFQSAPLLGAARRRPADPSAHLRRDDLRRAPEQRRALAPPFPPPAPAPPPPSWPGSTRPPGMTGKEEGLRITGSSAALTLASLGRPDAVSGGGAATSASLSL